MRFTFRCSPLHSYKHGYHFLLSASTVITGKPSGKIALLLYLCVLIYSCWSTASYQLRYFNVYDLGFAVVGSWPLLFAIYTILSLILIPALYREFRKKQIA